MDWENRAMADFQDGPTTRGLGRVFSARDRRGWRDACDSNTCLTNGRPPLHAGGPRRGTREIETWRSSTGGSRARASGEAIRVRSLRFSPGVRKNGAIIAHAAESRYLAPGQGGFDSAEALFDARATRSRPCLLHDRRL